MTSIINYRFRSMKNYVPITFEGTGIPLWELKYEIITQRKMTSKDFDLLFYDSNTNDRITDEYQMITKNSHIIVERIPLWMSGSGYNVKEKKKDSKTPSYKSSHQTPAESYVCFRCGNKGHYIQYCPTNEDKSFDILRIRKPSGIPKDFLMHISGEEAAINPGMLVTTEGSYVIAQPQVHEWRKKEVASHSNIDIPESLKCLLCGNLYTSPVLTSCKHVFCETCIISESSCPICKENIEGYSEDLVKKMEVDKFMEKR